MNKYEKQARKKEILGEAGEIKAKGKMNKWAEFGINAASGIGGGFAGAMVGRASFILGLGAMGAGVYFEVPAVTSFGIGMATSAVATGGMLGDTQPQKPKGWQAAKERVKLYAQSFKEKLFLDKLKSKKTETKTTDQSTTTTTTTTTTPETTNTVGEVEYFKYPVKPDAMDLSELEKYERELEKSAEKFKAENPETEIAKNESVSGLDGELLDVNERLI